MLDAMSWGGIGGGRDWGCMKEGLVNHRLVGLAGSELENGRPPRAKHRDIEARAGRSAG